MVLTINNGNSLLLFFVIFFAVILLLMFLRPGQRGQKLISVVVLAATCSVVYFMFGRPSDLVIDNTGIHSNAYGKIDIPWSDIKEKEIITDYADTEWKPAAMINGSGMIGFRSGHYKLSNGEKAKVLTQKSDDAVIFRTDDELYLFAVNEHEKFIEAASEYIDF